MEIKEYFDQMKELHILLLTFIKNSEFENDDLQILINFIKNHNIPNNREKFMNFLQLILQISNNHHRYPLFINKIEKILINFKEDIGRYFTDYDILRFFQSNKFILLFLIKENILHINNIFDEIIWTNDQNGNQYFYFLIPEITKYVDEKKIKKIKYDFDFTMTENYEEKREEGVNDSYISSLIRDDLVDEFISYINRKNISLKSVIKRSVFETNSFLIENDPTLIEYATFYSSIRIFQYLKLNNVELSPSLWLYAVHSDNPEMIYLLEENKVNLPQNTFISILKEAIKCHHNDIVDYITNNYSITNEIIDLIYEYSFRYYNYSLFPDDYENINSKYVFFYISINNNYKSLISSFLPNKMDEFNSIEVSIKANNTIKIYCYLLNKKRITKDIFSNSNDLRRIVIPPSIKSIEENSFKNCSSLTHIVGNEYLLSIGSYSFQNCSSLKTIEIHSFVSSIGSYAFDVCSSLTEISIPIGVTTINRNTFSGCKSLKTVILPSSVKLINQYAFYECTSLTKIVFPSSLIIIGEYSFCNCKSLKQIYIPSSVTTIKEFSFKGCSSIQYISCEVSFSLSKIEDGAFFGCNSIEEIKLPRNLEKQLRPLFPNNSVFVSV